MQAKIITGKSQQLVLQSLVNPASILKLDNQDWELLIRILRSSKLLAHFGRIIDHSGLMEQIPEKVLTHFLADQRLVDYRIRLALWELNRLQRALAEMNVEVIILKGGGYMMLQLPMSEGRAVSDVDILVAKRDIERVEKKLLEQDWVGAQLDEYDQQYYRTWMHEIPPIRHRDRFIEVDIHHAILPLTSRLQPNPELLLDDAIEAGELGFKVLSPCDMLLHSCVHLFYDAELNGSDFRDLVDQDMLIRTFIQQDSAFFDVLVKRAKQLQLQRPLFYTLYFTKKLLKTPVPDKVIQQINTQPPLVIKKLMDNLVPLGLLPEHPDHPGKIVALARWLLFVRSHYLRMPLYLLLPHLFKKRKKHLAGHKDNL